MKKLVIFSCIILLSAAFSNKENSHAANMHSFSWLIGKWKMETKKGIIYEKWKSSNDSTLSGKSMLVKNTTGDTVFLEKIQLVYRNNAYYYIPVAEGQNNNQPVEFKLTSHNENGFIAENPEHDFPKRILYNLITKDSIHAVVDGGPAMPQKKTNFYYSRQKQ